MAQETLYILPERHSLVRTVSLAVAQTDPALLYSLQSSRPSPEECKANVAKAIEFFRTEGHEEATH